MSNNIFIGTIKLVFKEIILNIIFFPFWWYSFGLLKVLKFIGKQIKSVNYNLGLKILLVNLFKPMYGDYTVLGRIISFFARLVLILLRAILMLLWLILMLLILIIWLGLPILVVAQILSLKNTGHSLIFFLS